MLSYHLTAFHDNSNIIYYGVINNYVHNNLVLYWRFHVISDFQQALGYMSVYIAKETWSVTFKGNSSSRVLMNYRVCEPCIYANTYIGILSGTLFEEQVYTNHQQTCTTLCITCACVLVTCNIDDFISSLAFTKPSVRCQGLKCSFQSKGTVFQDYKLCKWCMQVHVLISGILLKECKQIYTNHQQTCIYNIMVQKN